MKIITKAEFEKASKIDKLHMPGLASLLMEIMKINEVNEVFKKAEHLQGEAFIDKILQIIGITIEFDESELNNFPKKGAFLAIANHPYGGIEGLILLKIMCIIRPDSKLMANFLLKKIPNLSDYFIGVNPFETVENSSSISGIKSTIIQLNSGIPIGIFPAGEVSTYKTKMQKITDRSWHPVVGKLIKRADVPVVPIYFHSNNGLLFNLLSLIHPSLRTAKLPSELFNKQGHIIKLRIGKPVKPSELPFYDSPIKLLDYFRKKSQEIIAPISVEDLDREITNLTEFLVCTERNYEVYICSSTVIPTILKEIGRLREVTFREIGEGTNKRTDLDEYDINYNHLFIWDKESKMIVGAYRIGKGSEIFHSMGKRGFYLNELFKIKKQFYPILMKSLELGRSWIRKEYQQKPLPLFLLWKGIVQFLSKNSEYRYLIGPVSISNWFTKLSKSLIVEFIRNNNFDHELAQFVRPRKKFKVDFSKIDKDLLTEGSKTLKDLDSLISDIEITNMKIPVLLKQYLALNAKIISFNIDPKFSDSLDGFLILDIETIPNEILKKLGKNIQD